MLEREEDREEKGKEGGGGKGGGGDIGSGPGSIELWRLQNKEPTIKDIARSLAQYDVSGDSEMLFRMLDDAGY